MGGTRTINFVRYPPMFGRQQYVMPNDFVVSNVDLAPVIFELRGIRVSDEYILDGQSWIADVQRQINNAGNVQQSCCQYRFIDQYNSHSILTAQYQYIYRANPQRVDAVNWYTNILDEEQIYDLIADPNQRINQITNGALAPIITVLQTLMRDYIQDTCPISTGCKMPEYRFSSSRGAVTSGNTLNLTASLTFNLSPSPTMNPFASTTSRPTSAMPSVSPTNEPTMDPTKAPSFTANTSTFKETRIINFNLDESENQKSWINPSEFGLMQFLIYSVVGMGLLTICIYCVWKGKDKQRKGYLSTTSNSHLSGLEIEDEQFPEFVDNESMTETNIEIIKESIFHLNKLNDERIAINHQDHYMNTKKFKEFSFDQDHQIQQQYVE